MLRSTQTELLDNDDIPFEDIKQNMQELDFINRWLGGHSITICGVKKILSGSKTTGKIIHICEAGCGGGDNLMAIATWCAKNNIAVHLTGIDKKKECIDFAKEKTAAAGYTWIVSDYKDIYFSHQKPDIIFSSLFCHHFSDDALVAMMQWMRDNCSMGFFVNDLHRHFLAYYSIKWLTKLLSNSYLVKNDAPLSVRRGFKRKEWETIMQRANIKSCAVQWKWAFRWLITATS